MDIETRLTNLENLVNGLIVNMNSHNTYIDADINGCRHTEGELSHTNDVQDVDISDNSAAVFDLAEMEDDNSAAVFDLAEAVDENSEAVFDLAEMASDLDARVTALEEKGE